MAPPNPPPVIPAALKKLLPRSLDAQHVSIRVRTDKKMNSLIKVALAFLRDDPDKPIVLHSFPTPRPAPATSTASSSSAPTMSLHGSNSVDAVPKLVSVVEVIKREYVRFLSEASAAAAAAATATGPVQSDKGKEKAVERVNAGKRQQGLHQYSLLTTFERLGYDTTAPTTSEGATTTTATVKDVQSELERQELIKMEWLTGSGRGKNTRPKVKHTPCMVVVLCLQSLPDLEAKGCDFTHQSPLVVPKQPKANKRSDDPPGEADEGATKPKRRRRRGGKKPSTATGEGEKENEDQTAPTAMAVDAPEAAAGGGKE